MNNPLLMTSGLPHFAAVRPEHVAVALEQRLSEARALVEKLVAEGEAPSWDNLVAPLSACLDGLEQMWGAVSHLNAVVNTPELRDAYNAGLPLLTEFHSALSQDKRLYQRYLALRESNAYVQLSPSQQRAIEHSLRDFRLGGVALPEPDRSRFKAIQEEQAQLSASFDDHLLDATQDYSLRVNDGARLAGLPADVIEEARAKAKSKGEDGYVLTLLAPCYRPVMQYAEDRALRAEMHRAFATRASELGVNPERDNTAIIQQLLGLREEEARLLAFPNFGALSLVPKMAGSVDEVIAFLRDLAARARPFALRDWATLVEFARQELGLSELQPHDVAFASERLKQRDYAFSDQEVRAYFPIEKVLAGLFALTRQLYGVVVVETPAEAWHADVRHFELRDERDESLIGSFYLDLYARQTKQGGAWMNGALPLRIQGQGTQHPVVFLTCNFAAPVADKPATLTHDDVTTLFHEFGHGLHHLLTREPTPGVSGMEGFEWDAVELPSQFMENFCWEWDIVAAMSAHVDTGAPLPRTLFDRMVKARHFQAGLFLLRQIEFGLFDMLLHTQVPPQEAKKVLDQVRHEVAVVSVAAYDRFANSFGHIFAGGYAAGYYSYLWAEVLSADTYSRFEEAGNTADARRAVGIRFRDEFLARGSARPALQSFEAFRGRSPQISAFLRHNGLISENV